MSSGDSDFTLMSRLLLPEIKTALQSFTSSPNKFRVLRTVPTSPIISPVPKTLYVLDSSFNPPTKAHLQIATSAILHDHGASPRRLLLLLATQNADKAPKPASFEHRLAMMTIFAEDLRTHLAQKGRLKEGEAVAVDVGVTTEPYFNDKAAAIDDSRAYDPPPEQVHLTGFDTLVRLLNPKYYPPEHTLTPLEPFLGRHRVRVTYRTGADWGEREEQGKYLRDLKEGRREHEGGKKEWADRFELVEGRADGEEVVSSTRVRDAIKRGDKEALRGLVTDRVREWIMQEELYTEPE
ncbi:MAG: hypothetical protein M1830_003027 [Pleopsidium flavum]|nr:MAG: hypothetical protein M1830_003027 [Pleopsidium flavum]